MKSSKSNTIILFATNFLRHPVTIYQPTFVAYLNSFSASRIIQLRRCPSNAIKPFLASQEKLSTCGGRRGVYGIIQPIHSQHLQFGLVLDDYGSPVTTDKIDTVRSSQRGSVKIAQVGQANVLGERLAGLGIEA